MKRLLSIALAALLLLSFHVQQYQASRILYDQDVNKELGVQSLQRGDTPSTGASGCTNIPNTGGPSCPSVINSMNVAGNGLSHANAYPRLTVEFGGAAATTTTH
ncbi:uncharacterized protein LOC125371122 [Ricinus communis]|uniref:uncharacterized protein LOC125371122 n=1 Tax=Ricinus communis TaxID=3988 RepID=UPI00201AA40C|nr:uncharacterized protein LOC125371122 [Ricinus communis]